MRRDEDRDPIGFYIEVFVRSKGINCVFDQSNSRIARDRVLTGQDTGRPGQNLEKGRDTVRDTARDTGWHTGRPGQNLGYGAGYGTGYGTGYGMGYGTGYRTTESKFGNGTGYGRDRDQWDMRDGSNGINIEQRDGIRTGKAKSTGMQDGTGQESHPVQP